MDELAAHAVADPIAFRLRHLKHPRLIDVLHGVADAAKWQTRPSPAARLRRTGRSAGRGVACVAHEGTNSFGALVAEVEVNHDTGAIEVTRIVVCVDCGPVSNPDGLRNQTEGGALQGMSRALLEEVTWDDQKITSFDWARYHSLSLGSAVPDIAVKIIERTDVEATGAGELSITLIAGAIANAVFDATGARIRQVPFTADRVKAALQHVS
jgi:CO/xanthine dehydrogenase Mo-binding subunit